jgi:phosphomannomutase
LLAQSFLDDEPGATIIHDPRLTWNTVEIVKAGGGKAIQCKTGHAFIKERMRKENAVYGGEMSAHHYFRDFFYCDSGMVPWLLVVELMAKSGKKLSELVDERVKAFPVSGEINRRVENVAELLVAVERHYSAQAESVDHTDGLGMNFKDWRFSLRLSNTEPVVRLNVESRGDEVLMREKTEELLALIEL